MKSFNDALNLVLSTSYELGNERTGLMESLGRVLAEDVVSDINMPPFDKSAMDGFACRKEDLQMHLEIIETLPAGKVPEKKVSKGQCTRIMTGAMVPEGANCVIMVEDTEVTKADKVIFTGQAGRLNIAYKADDVKEGDIVINKGHKINAQEIAVMAAVGYTNPLLAVRPRVGIISTGDEIVEPDTKPGISQIRNSNGYQLVAQVNNAGALADYNGIARDNEKVTFDLLEKTLFKNDIVLLTGGVSMGDFDFIPYVFEKLKVKQLFQTIKIQPGKPTVFGTLGKKRIFGLPGNPVSSFVIFKLFVEPLIHKMMGLIEEEVLLKLPLGTDYFRKKSERMSIIPGKIHEDGKIYPVDYHGSAHLFSLINADGLITVPPGKNQLKKEELVDVRQI